MADVVNDAQQDFWRPPTLSENAIAATTPAAAPEMAELCSRCHSEFMIGAHFCHSCGLRRPLMNAASDAATFAGRWNEAIASMRTAAVDTWKSIHFPAWLRYLHFHEIKAWIGLPTASLVFFFIGLGCVLGAIGVSIVFRASNLAEFQAIQMWRLQWLVGATASFVAAILLKKPTGGNHE